MDVPFRDDFGTFDRDTWLPHYLPHWSSRAESAATWAVDDSVLTLSIPPSQGRWCESTHDGPLRVSGIQSGSFSWPVGSTVGQQSFVDDLVVCEEEPFWTGWTPQSGLIEVTARMDLSPRSMASVWLVGLEDQPDRCGEICMFEVFGDSLDEGGPRSARVSTRFAIPPSPTTSAPSDMRSTSARGIRTPRSGSTTASSSASTAV